MNFIVGWVERTLPKRWQRKAAKILFLCTAL